MEWIKVGDSYPKDKETVLIFHRAHGGGIQGDGFCVATFFEDRKEFEYEDCHNDFKGPSYWCRLIIPKGKDK